MATPRHISTVVFQRSYSYHPHSSCYQTPSPTTGKGTVFVSCSKLELVKNFQLFVFNKDALCSYNCYFLQKLIAGLSMKKLKKSFHLLPSESTENFSNPNQLKALSPSLTHLQVF